MKYIAKNIPSSLNETVESLLKKVAVQLGVSVTELRIRVIKREWHPDKTGDHLVVSVEAETKDFIHNTPISPPKKKSALSLRLDDIPTSRGGLWH